MVVYEISPPLNLASRDIARVPSGIDNKPTIYFYIKMSPLLRVSYGLVNDILFPVADNGCMTLMMCNTPITDKP